MDSQDVDLEIVALARRYGVSPHLISGTLLERYRASVDAAVRARKRRTVDGHLILSDGFSGSGLKVKVYQHRVGDAPEMLASGDTEEDGFYSIKYGDKSGSTAIEIRVVGSDDNEITLTDPVFGVDVHQTLNLVAPAETVAGGNEFGMMVDSVKAAFSSEDVLKDAVEDDDRHDVTLIGETTGWDGRLLALATTAMKTSTTTDIPGEALYGVARLGGPSTEEGLALLTAVQRTFQMSPSDDAMTVLLEEGLTSARSVASMNRESFVANYGNEFARETEALLVHRKATQIRSVALTIATDAQSLRSATPLPSMAPTALHQNGEGSSVFF